MTLARSKVDADQDARLWGEALAWYEANPSLPQGREGLEHFDYVYEAGGYWFDEDNAGFDGLGAYFFKGPMGVTWFSNQRYVDEEMFADVNIHDEMEAITTPTLMMWGRHDLVVPLAVGAESFARLATPAEDKRFVVIEEAAHTIAAEQPERCLVEMLDFIERYAGG